MHAPFFPLQRPSMLAAQLRGQLPGNVQHKTEIIEVSSRAQSLRASTASATRALEVIAVVTLAMLPVDVLPSAVAQHG